MKPFQSFSIRVIAWGVCCGAALGLSAGVASAADTAQAEQVPAQSKSDSPQVHKTSKLQLRMNMNDDEWQVVKPAISRVVTLSSQLRDLQDLKRSLSAGKAPKSKSKKQEVVDTSRVVSAPPEQPAWLLELSDKAAALRSAVDDPTLRPLDVEARLAEFRTARTRAEQQVSADLAQARQQLRDLLTARQELAMTLSGLLD
jgi:hypothetical protein